MMKLIFTSMLLGLSILPASSINIIEVAIGSQVVLPCQMTTGFGRCHWLHHGTPVYSDYPANNSNPTGYSVVGNPSMRNCSLLITSIKLEDDGAWNCFMPHNTGDKRVDLAVIVIPSENKLLVGDIPLNSGGIKTVKPDPTYGQVKVKCASFRSKPAPTIIWEVDGVSVDPDAPLLVTRNGDNQTLNVSSTITLQYEVFTQQNTTVYQIEPNEKEKIVRCIIGHKLYKEPVILKAVLEMEYATTTCQLSVHPILGNDSAVFLVCEADGVPEPTYTIQKITPGSDIIESVFLAQNHTVAESGIYVCEATYQEGHAVQSKKIVVNFRKPEEEKNIPSSKTNTKPTKVSSGKRGSAISAMRSARADVVFTLTLAAIILGPIFRSVY